MQITIQQISAFYSENPEVKQSQVVYEIDLGDKSYEIFIRSNHLPVQTGLEPAVSLALLAAMRLNRPIHAKGALSRSFIEGVKKVMTIYASGFDCFSSVQVTADLIYEAKAEVGFRKASFFSGGVDSFFTLHKGQSDLTDIVVIHGFDIHLKDADRRKRVHQMSIEVAAQKGVRLIEVESNFARIIKDYGLWVQHGHGLALISAARALAGEISEIRIPGTYTIHDQRVWGSSMLTDPNFSDERIDIIHDACNARRIEKIEQIATDPIALKYLRVCGDVKYDGMYNCCRCEKCIRTMIPLHALNVLDKSEAFTKELNSKIVADALLISPEIRQHAIDNLELVKKYRFYDTDFINAIQKQINRPIWLAKLLLRKRKKVRHFKDRIRKVRKFLYPTW